MNRRHQLATEVRTPSITVSNGTIRGLGGNGIRFASGAGARIEGVTAVSNGGEGIIAGGGFEDAIITQCHAQFNGSVGIAGAGTLSNSSALNNNLDGVVWLGGSVTGTLSRFNGGNGFSGSGIFSGNTAAGNSLAGISAFNDIPSVILSNALYSNGTTLITAGSGSVVLNNVVR